MMLLRENSARIPRDITLQHICVHTLLHSRSKLDHLDNRHSIDPFDFVSSDDMADTWALSDAFAHAFRMHATLEFMN
jgi:hypothetical protein